MGNLFGKSNKTKKSKIKELQPSSKYGDVLIMGSESVGKTAIANRLVYNYYTEQYIPTSSETRYEVDALLEMTEAGEVECARQDMILKKSFKKSEFGRNRPDIQKKIGAATKTTIKRVVTTNTKQPNVGRRYTEGAIRGLKKLEFSLIDMPSDLSEMQPTTYQAYLHNAKGFFLVCSFDSADSLARIDKILKDIRDTDEGPVVIIANKSDISEEDRVLDEQAVQHHAKQLNLPYCSASMSSKDGYQEMAQLLLNEINISAEIEEQLYSIPEDYAYHTENDFGDF